jgi:hypothetical protein
MMNYRTIINTEMVKRSLLILSFCCIVATSTAQNCSCISGGKDKKSDKETWTGITNSTDFYSLLIQRENNYKDLTLEPKYTLLLNAASRIVLSDSLVNTKGEIVLLLKDNSELILEDAKCFNNPMPFGFCVAFSVSVSREQLEIISKNPIVTFTAFGILRTSFKERKQNEQQKIINCLLQRE